MTLSREEIAVRLACADVQGSSLPPDKDRAVWAAQVVATTDAIGAALTHTPAPVAPPAGKYEPRPGDVVDLWKRDGEDPAFVRVVTSPHSYALLSKRTGEPVFDATYTFDEARELGGRDIRYLRDSTDAEKRAAGLAVPPPAPTPAPEVLTPDVPEGSTIAQLAAEQRASMGLTASMGSTQHFTHAATPAPEAKRPAPCPPPVAGRVDGGEALIDREWLAADILRNITAAGHKVFDRPADEVAKQIHALIEATLGPVPEAGK